MRLKFPRNLFEGFSYITFRYSRWLQRRPLSFLLVAWGAGLLKMGFVVLMNIVLMLGFCHFWWHTVPKTGRSQIMHISWNLKEYKLNIGENVVKRSDIYVHCCYLIWEEVDYQWTLILFFCSLISKQVSLLNTWTQSAIPGPAASASSGNLSEMQILSPTSELLN